MTERAAPTDGSSLVIAGVRLLAGGTPVDITIEDGRIDAIDAEGPSSARRIDGGGALAFPGFVETHIHLDKAGILDRCPICSGTLREAIELTARAKAGFTEEDVYRRAAKVVESAVTFGTIAMRTFVEVDPRVGMRSFNALTQLKADYADMVDLRICAFVQEGLTNEPDTLPLVEKALHFGADQVGGCPYTDPDPDTHIAMLFELAARHDVDLDFHVDFDLDPEGSALPEIIRQTHRHGFEGRVSVGHATKLSAMDPEAVRRLADRLAGAGIAVTALPSTDLFLTGRDSARLVPRGVAPLRLLQAQGVLTTIASNNILNPFTPYGDANLLRMANLFANVAQLSSDADMQACLDMVAGNGARLLGVDQDLKPGAPATLVLLDCASPSDAVRTIAQPLMGLRLGRLTFERAKPQIYRVGPAEHTI